MKRLLMIAYHFPPLAGSSGIQRTLRFVQQLPEWGWKPIVLTAHPRAYATVGDDLVREVPEGTVVERAFALDSSRHLAIMRRYPGFLARPDRWLPWYWGAVPAGLKLVRRYRPAALWSTYPIATAHLIGAALRRRTGLPWIADFRDPMAQDGYPADPKTWQAFKAIEDEALHQAACSAFTTPGAARMYRQRYPDVAAGRVAVIENGYDEESYAGLAASPPLNPGRITLLHSGIVYPSERDPTQLFVAMRRLRGTGELRAETFSLRLRAPVHDAMIGKLAAEHGVADLIEVLPTIPYRDALEEMLRADGLLVLQAANCNEQIPAKLYEYLRARRPVLALTDPAGDTAGVLRAAGLTDIARLDSAEEIRAALARFVERIGAGTAALPLAEHVAGASRRARTRELAALLDRVSGGS
jgi:glycosyltransferase involved in cell wall biosynthesis